jgi:AraC-like DNA-binding protein
VKVLAIRSDSRTEAWLSASLHRRGASLLLSHADALGPQLRRVLPDVLVVTICDPLGRSNEGVVRRMRALLPYRPVVALSRLLASESRHLVAVVHAGISAIVAAEHEDPWPLFAELTAYSPEAKARARLRKLLSPPETSHDHETERLALLDLLLRDPPGLNASEVATAMGVCRRTLHRYCHRHYHLTPGELLARFRVAHAVALLCGGSRSVNSIASYLRYSSSAQFRRHLRKYTGHRPQLFRHADVSDDALASLVLLGVHGSTTGQKR